MEEGMNRRESGIEDRRKGRKEREGRGVQEA